MKITDIKELMAIRDGVIKELVQAALVLRDFSPDESFQAKRWGRLFLAQDRAREIESGIYAMDNKRKEPTK